MADPLLAARCNASVAYRGLVEAGDLIKHPFFDNGPQDIGLGWRVLVSVQRVMIGFGFAALVGVLLGTLVGQSVWAMRGLDPIFQVLRTVPPLAWLPLALAAFRDSNPSAIFVIFITSKVVELNIVDHASDNTIGRVLKKMSSSLISCSNGLSRRKQAAHS